MIFHKTPITGLHVIEAKESFDKRGSFARVYCEKEFLEQGITVKPFVQMNHSWNSSKGTLRGMHFQFPPRGEEKLIRCIQGSVYDVAVDLREGSDTFLEWYGTILSEKNRKSIFIPRGFAHGFLTLQDNTQLFYHHTEFYAPGNEGAIAYDDPTIAINWPDEVVVISKRDSTHENLDTSFKGIKV